MLLPLRAATRERGGEWIVVTPRCAVCGSAIVVGISATGNMEVFATVGEGLSLRQLNYFSSLAAAAALELSLQHFFSTF